jgi:hypothetical protein
MSTAHDDAALGSTDRPYLFFSLARAATSARTSHAQVSIVNRNADGTYRSLFRMSASSGEASGGQQDVFDEFAQEQSTQQPINGFHDRYNVSAETRWDEALMNKLRTIDADVLKTLVNAHIAHPATPSPVFSNVTTETADLVNLNGMS